MRRQKRQRTTDKRQAEAGGEMMPDGATMRLYPEVTMKLSRVSRREQVLAGFWAGKGTKEIAAELRLSPKTVEYHRAVLFRVFGVSDVVSLCRRGLAVGVLRVEAGK
jgi:DNA-binding NarL/FixJ family response regulator